MLRFRPISSAVCLGLLLAAFPRPAVALILARSTTDATGNNAHPVRLTQGAASRTQRVAVVE